MDVQTIIEHAAEAIVNYQEVNGMDLMTGDGDGEHWMQQLHERRGAMNALMRLLPSADDRIAASRIAGKRIDDLLPIWRKNNENRELDRQAGTLSPRER